MSLHPTNSLSFYKIHGFTEKLFGSVQTLEAMGKPWIYQVNLKGIRAYLVKL